MPSLRLGGEHRAAATRHRPEQLRGEERLDESDRRSDPPGGELHVGAEVLAPRRIDRLVARIVETLHRKRREALLREEAVDQRLIVRIETSSSSSLVC